VNDGEVVQVYVVPDPELGEHSKGLDVACALILDEVNTPAALTALKN
jgi:hypothetical protein